MQKSHLLENNTNELLWDILNMANLHPIQMIT